MSTCLDCGWPADVEYVKGVVINVNGSEGRYKLRNSTANEVAKEVGGYVVGTCDIRQRDCGCDGPSDLPQVKEK